MTWQPASVLYPDAELRFTADLRALLATQGDTDVWVGRKVPPVRPSRAVQVVRDGGASSNLRDRPRIRVNVWDGSDQKATDLARLIVALVPEMTGANGVLRTEHLSGPYEIPEAGAYRRYLLFEIQYRGEPLT